MQDRQEPSADLSTRFIGQMEDRDLAWAASDGHDMLQQYAENGGSLEEAVLLPLALRALDRVPQEIEELLRQQGAPETETDLALMFALFLYGQSQCDGVQIAIGELLFGNQPRGLTDLKIAPGVHRGDFKIDFLVSLTEIGPNPDYQGNPGESVSRTSTRETALVRERGEYGDRKLQRQALASLGLPPMIIVEEELRLDPFAVAKRVVDDLLRATDDDIYPI